MGIFQYKNTNQTSIREETSAILSSLLKKKANCWKNINSTLKSQLTVSVFNSTLSVVRVIENGKKIVLFLQMFPAITPCTTTANVSSFLKTENLKSYATNSTSIQQDF